MPKYPEVTRDTERARNFFIEKIAYTMGPVELQTLIDENPDEIQVVDVRKFEAYSQGHIPTAINIPSDKLEEYMDKIPKDKIVVVYCYTQQCHLAAKCAITFVEHGHPTMELEGGFEEWKKYGFEVIVS